MLSWVSKAIWGSGSKSGPLMKIKGTFFDLEGSKWRCVYNRAEASVVRVGDLQYDLVIERVFEEGERELEDEGDEGDRNADTFTFPIGAALHITAEKSHLGSPAFTWQYSVPGGLARYTFEPSDDVTKATYDTFQFTLGRGVFESTERRTHEGVPQEQIMSLLDPRGHAQPAAAPATPTKAPQPRESDVAKSPESVYPSLDISSPVKPATPVKATQPQEAPVPANRYLETVSPMKAPAAGIALVAPPAQIAGVEGRTIARVPADLFLFDQSRGVFQLQQQGVSAAIQELGKFRYGLFVVGEGDRVLVGQVISNEIFPYFLAAEQSVIWMYRLNSDVWTWSAKFPSRDDDRAFKDTFAKCLYETTRGEPFEKAKQEDQAAIIGAMRDDVDLDTSSVMDTQDEITEDDMKDFEEMDVDEGRKEKEGDSEDEDEDEDEEEQRKEENKLLAVTGKHNRALVVRGSQIGVFTATQANKLKFETRIKQIRDTAGAAFSPRKIMLHQGEESLLMLHPEHHKTVLRMDLNRGEVVDEWAASDDYPVNEVLPQEKYAEQSAAQTFVGMNRVGFFMLDPRQGGSTKIVQNKSFFSLGRSAPGFTCGAATQTGSLAMATEKGEVRLYDHKLMTQGSAHSDMEARQPRAKTTYPGFGDPVIGIDVTGDGKWVLATCKTYLLLIPAVDNTGKSGFEAPLGKNKPVPRRLQIKPEHVRMLKGEVSFTPAKFSTGEDRERAIVTSSGPYIITWNFRKVKQNVLDFYQISRLDNTVVADQFRFGDADSVVVAMPDDVAIAHKTIPDSFRRSSVAPARR